MLYSMRNLQKIYGGRTVLDIEQLDIEQGRIHALLGPNGSGKTTLLHILSFLNKPSRGTLFYHNHPVDFSEKSLYFLRRQVVLVEQHPLLFSSTVFKNVEFGLKVRGVEPKKRHKIVEECLDMVGMGRFLKAKGYRLSGGETQRVAIARALACNPQVLFFDEPTASVDVESQIAIENIIRDIHLEKKLSIIICTHNLLQAAKLTNERIFLFAGRPSQSTYENIFGGPVKEKDGLKSCIAAPGVAFPVPAQAGKNTRISINPKTISLSLEDNWDEPGKVMTGRVKQLSQEMENFVRIIVDVGLPLSVLMRIKEFRKLSFSVGEQVFVFCRESGVEILSE